MIKNVSIFVIVLANFSYSDLQNKIDSLRQEVEKNPDNYKLYFDLGVCYTALGDYQNALNEFQKTLELKSDYLLAKYKLAMVNYEMDSLERAKELFEEIKTKYPNRPAVYEWLGSIYSIFGEYDKAISVYKEYNKHQKFPEHELLARTYGIAGKYSEAIKCYQEAIKHYSYPSGFDYELSVIYFKRGDSLQGQKWFNKAIKDLSEYYRYYGEDLEPQELLSYKSVWYYWIGNFDKAVAAIESLIQKKWENAIDLYDLGIFKITKGDTNGLLTIKNACVQDTTGFIEIMYNALERIKANDYVGTEKFLRQNNRYLKRSGIANALLAFILERQEKYGEAKKYWFTCYCKLPLGVDVESMRNFIKGFVNNLQGNQ